MAELSEESQTHMRKFSAIFRDRVGLNLAPSASFTWTKNVWTVQFTDTTTDPDIKKGFTYYWTFGDGATSTQKNPSRTYQSPGTKTVTLKVTDHAGANSTATKQIMV